MRFERVGTMGRDGMMRWRDDVRADDDVCSLGRCQNIGSRESLSATRKRATAQCISTGWSGPDAVSWLVLWRTVRRWRSAVEWICYG